MTQDQLVALRANLQRELDFCDRKSKDLRALVKAESPLTDAAVLGVTYGSNGLGGCYGGAPRARCSMLDGVWDCRSDIATELDTGSEATDLADSWLLDGQSEPGHDAESPVRKVASAGHKQGVAAAAAAAAAVTGAGAGDDDGATAMEED